MTNLKALASLTFVAGSVVFIWIEVSHFKNSKLKSQELNKAQKEKDSLSFENPRYQELIHEIRRLEKDSKYEGGFFGFFGFLGLIGSFILFKNLLK